VTGSRGGGATGSIAFDAVAKSYDATRGGMERGRRMAATLTELLPADGPLLEIGVGTGLVAASLAQPAPPERPGGCRRRR
jgi:ubiquinone/menaquinone biosynthesis C-methylase UbiE